MRRKFLHFFDKKQPASAAAQPSSQAIEKPVPPYNVIFVDTSSGKLAAQLVMTYTRNNAAIVEDGWLCGIVPHLDGPKFWACPALTAERKMDDWIPFLQKLQDPVRLMVCVPYGERFEHVANFELFRELNRIFRIADIGRLDIVITGAPEWRGSAAQLLAEVRRYGANVCQTASKWLSAPVLYWWGGSTQAYYNALPVAGRKLVSTEASTMLIDLRKYHGLPFRSVHHEDEARPSQLKQR